jgi:metal-dependent amidase/aminoacylase/carboxypeptidase family protein
MQDHGFDVEKHYKDLSTAWRATFTHTPTSLPPSSTANAPLRTLGLNSEMDALPGIGHACGHNLIAIAGVGVALALRAALIKHDLPGKIVLLGTPAEEGGVGKVVLLDRGAYNDMDVCLMCHPGPGPKMSAGTGPSLALTGIDVEYFGHT